MSDAEPAEQYLKSFHWNKVKYRADKPLGEIIDTLQKVFRHHSWALGCFPALLTVAASGSLQHR